MTFCPPPVTKLNSVKMVTLTLREQVPFILKSSSTVNSVCARNDYKVIAEDLVISFVKYRELFVSGVLLPNNTYVMLFEVMNSIEVNLTMSAKCHVH